MAKILELPSTPETRKAMVRLHEKNVAPPAKSPMFKVPSLEMRVAISKILESEFDFQMREKLYRLADYLGRTRPSSIDLEGMLLAINLDMPPKRA